MTGTTSSPGPTSPARATTPGQASPVGSPSSPGTAAPTLAAAPANTGVLEADVRIACSGWRALANLLVTILGQRRRRCRLCSWPGKNIHATSLKTRLQGDLRHQPTDASDTTSIRSFLLTYRMQNGRTYHAYQEQGGDGEYKRRISSLCFSNPATDKLQRTSCPMMRQVSYPLRPGNLVLGAVALFKLLTKAPARE